MLAWCSRASRIVIIGLTLAGVGCSNAPKRSISVGEVSLPEDRIGMDDTFDVRVYGEAELSGTFRVATDGTIDYPLVGRVLVSGLRTGEIQKLLVEKLKDPTHDRLLVRHRMRHERLEIVGNGRMLQIPRENQHARLPGENEDEANHERPFERGADERE